jgi:predicted dithiol-disulfide oxidoreductase (DUF899 family)
MTTTSTPGKEHRVVSREEWLKERVALLAEEKELTRRRDALASRVRDLSWVKVEKLYSFDAPTGRISLADLFGVRSQLIVYHFMFDPTWSQGCKNDYPAILPTTKERLAREWRACFEAWGYPA